VTGAPPGISCVCVSDWWNVADERMAVREESGIVDGDAEGPEPGFRITFEGFVGSIEKTRERARARVRAEEGARVAVPIMRGGGFVEESEGVNGFGGFGEGCWLEGFVASDLVVSRD